MRFPFLTSVSLSFPKRRHRHQGKLLKVSSLLSLQRFLTKWLLPSFVQIASLLIDIVIVLQINPSGCCDPCNAISTGKTIFVGNFCFFQQKYFSSIFSLICLFYFVTDAEIGIYIYVSLSRKMFWNSRTYSLNIKDKSEIKLDSVTLLRYHRYAQAVSIVEVIALPVYEITITWEEQGGQTMFSLK